MSYPGWYLGVALIVIGWWPVAAVVLLATALQALKE